MLSCTTILTILKRDKLHYSCFSVGLETEPHRLRLPGERTLHFHISNPHSDSDSYCSFYKMMVSKDEHDDSERDGSTSGGDEHDDDHDLLLLPMTVLKLSQVKRSGTDTPAISG